MFLAPKQSETTAPSPAAGLPGKSWEPGKASSEPDQKACLLPTGSQALAEGRVVPQGPEEGREICASVLGTTCPRSPVGHTLVGVGEGLPLQGRASLQGSMGAQHVGMAWSRHMRLSGATPPGHADGVSVRLCVQTPVLVPAGPSC